MKKILTYIALSFCLISTAKAQQYIYVSKEGIRQVLRVNFAATRFSLTPKDSTANLAYGVHLSNEVKIISAFWNKEHAFTFHDAFYFDINLGGMNNTPRKNSPTAWGTGDEKKFAMSLNMGYLILAGYRSPRWALLGGVDFRWRSARIGDMNTPNTYSDNLFNYCRPVTLRGEYCLSDETADKRAIMMLWYDKGSATRSNYFSTRIEYPLGSQARWWLFFQYTNEKSPGEDQYHSTKAVDMTFNQFILGFRIQNALL